MPRRIGFGAVLAALLDRRVDAWWPPTPLQDLVLVAAARGDHREQRRNLPRNRTQNGITESQNTFGEQQKPQEAPISSKGAPQAEQERGHE